MTDTTKEAVTHSAATCLLMDGRFVKEADYRALAAERDALEKRVQAADDMAARAENVFRSEYHNTNHIEGAKQYFNANMEALAAYRATGGQGNE